MVPVICMATMDVAHESEPASQTRLWKRASVGRRWKSLVMHTPMSAPMKWPHTSMRGCASGASTAPYMSTAEAPYPGVSVL